MSLPRRIVVMLGSQGEADAALEAAAMLASATDARLAGLFVEDQELLDLAGLPAMVAGPGGVGRLTLERMERALREEARTCHRLMAQMAGRAHVSFEFAIMRGDRRTLMGEVSLEGDLVLCQAILGGPAAAEIVALARHSATAAAGVALIGPLTRLRTGAVVAIDDGDEAGRQTVALAARLAARRHEKLIVVALAETRKAAEPVIERARTIAGPGADLSTRVLPPDEPARLADFLAETEPCCVVGDLEGRPFTDDEAVAQAVRAARAPLILLRRPVM